VRADRLVAILLLMQARGRVTAGQVAEELEVSVATARRDLEALSAAGVPVYPQPGRGGGWSLVGGARTDLTGLTAGEARALFLLAGPEARAAPELRSALRKLTRALPATFRAEAEAAAGAVLVDPARWGEREAARDARVDLLSEAVVRRRKVRFGYAGRERLVDPWGLVDKSATWYLLAGTAAGRRTFRVDRIGDAELTDLAADRPDDLSLTEAWRETVELLEGRRSSATVTVLVEPRLVPVLRERFGRHLGAGTVDVGDGRVRVTVTGHTPWALAEQLAGWAGYVEVEPPDAEDDTSTDTGTGTGTVNEEVRAGLARIGRMLVERYG
jgi:predicted DNA-binding transcriptional regulator YafY